MPEEKSINPDHENHEKDMQFAGDEYVNMEGENRSTAAEGTLKESTDTIKDNEEESSGAAIGQANQSEQEAANDETKKTSLQEDETLDKDEVTS